MKKRTYKLYVTFFLVSQFLQITKYVCVGVCTILINILILDKIQ